MSDGFSFAMQKSSALRIIIGFAFLFIIWTLYLLLFPPFLGVYQALSNTLPFLNLPTSGVLGINAINNFLALEAAEVGGAFAILFTFVIVYFIILPAFRREGGTYGY